MYEVHELVSRITEEQRQQGRYHWQRWFVIGRERNKQRAIDLAANHPTRAVVAKPASSRKIFDNGKSPRIDPTLDL